MSYWVRQFFTRPEAHGKAIAEVAVTTIVALIPLLITAIVYNYKNEGTFDLEAGVSQAVGGGQLFLYAYGLIGTIIWLAFIKWDTPMHGPRRILGLVTILASFAIVAMLGLDPTISNAKNPTIVHSSYWTYALFLFMHYLLLFYLEIEPPPAKDSLDLGTQRLKQRYINLENSND